MSSLLLFLSLLQLASAHFHVDYPYWRGDSFKTQYTRPCGGVNVTTNRTEWPVNGGSLLFSAGHPWAITYVNLGIGNDDSVIFDVPLIPAFNQTGNGTVCFSKIQVPEGTQISPGTNASIQVIQLSELGSALYNCADITFSDNAGLLRSDKCQNSTNIGWRPLGASTSTTGTASTATNSNAASGLIVGLSTSKGIGVFVALLFNMAGGLF
ncbi:hypothetical protein CPC735_042320 [Coccidioides posadasii C735 delta SOWgp]|uniref:Copper acquisition factor BIM1-like domain-containing protein n=2 Tax=Coccidioides posadasii TaxID=199306 RepID=A0A0J6FJ82_COCPO|nr:hypothetical protein CPC735_042320 [Coccidioides posadasii C735 delta SOWgp]EER25788.1 hypothetical protein CPC735_042320 [Coccidioides posadasii C735 delta SOWgp]KMM69465.1 hypothetical protein CPAG_05780 [Coccidioides posadasii RMSCC 3488]|eukprot:XP_003067933.1 hypothetical protein CPC735_042320 [Coccidioides posadasii C735 delta SOWgp]